MRILNMYRRGAKGPDIGSAGREMGYGGASMQAQRKHDSSSLTCCASTETVPVEASELRGTVVRLGLKAFKGRDDGMLEDERTRGRAHEGTSAGKDGCTHKGRA